MRSARYLSSLGASRLNNQFSLRGWLVPSDPANLTVQDERAIRDAIAALHELCEDIKLVFHDKEIDCPALSQVLDNYWDAGIFEWLSFLFDHYHPLDASRWDVISYISCVLAYFIHAKPELVTDEADEKCLALAILLWVETDFDCMRSEYSDVYGWWAPFLNVIGKGMARIQTGPIQAEIMKTRKALSDSSIINLILKRLQSCDDLLETSDKQYTFLTNALANFALVDVSTGARLSRMVRTMADILQDMVTRAIHFDTGDAFLEACLKLFFIIGHKLRTGNSIYAVCEALDHFLLETLVDFSERFDHMLGPTYTGIPRESMKFLIDHSVLNILSDIMPKYMGYESVQLALFPVVTDDDSTKQMYSTVAREKWTRMCQSYGEATGLCDGSQDIFSISLCDNPMHGTRKKARKLWRCSGCESTWYCSKECQREHWVSGHRGSCVYMKSLKDSSTYETLCRRDHISVCRLAISYVRAEWDIVKDIAKKKHLRKPMSQLTVVVDSTEYPAKMDVVARDRVSVKAAALIPNATIIQCRVPMGPHVATITAAGYLANVYATVWCAGRSLMTYSTLSDGTS